MFQDFMDDFITWRTAAPFPHLVIDNFFDPARLDKIVEEWPWESEWVRYENPIEVKSAMNQWALFPPAVYGVLNDFVAPAFVDFLAWLTATPDLVADAGLHGGGLHMHYSGGRLNPHLDYSVHPKLDLQRKVNLILYVNPDWREEWGGHLGLWTNNAGKPGTLVKEVAPLFNRAVIFDTTNAWHGISRPITCPDGQARMSLATYYVMPQEMNDGRKRALFAPTAEQEGNAEVEELIKKRSRL